MSGDVLASMKSKTRKILDDALLGGERPLAVVNGREGEAIVLTSHRLVWVWARNFLMKGHDSVQVTDVMRISSGVTGISMSLRNGDDSTFEFWPTKTNRQAAEQFVRMVRGAHAPQAVPVQRNVADELAKLAGLRAQGVLTDQEFQAQKAALLA